MNKLAVSREIKIIDDIITEVNETDKINFIKGNQKYISNFYFDCTGFKRLLNKSKWKSYSDKLICNAFCFADRIWQKSILLFLIFFNYNNSLGLHMAKEHDTKEFKKHILICKSCKVDGNKQTEAALELKSALKEHFNEKYV